MSSNPVLILAAHDGKLEVFGDASISPLILNLPVTNGVESELALEQLVDEVLPYRYRQVHWPGMLRKSGWIRRTTTAELQERIEYGAAWDSMSNGTKTANQLVLEVLQ